MSSKFTRKKFLKTGAAAAAAFTIVPSDVLEKSSEKLHPLTN